jgi:hypothetical protein
MSDDRLVLGDYDAWGTFHRRPPRRERPSLDRTPIPIPDKLCPPGFALYSPSRSGDRSRDADRALQELGITPRSSRRQRAVERVQAGDGITIRRSGIGAVLRVS